MGQSVKEKVILPGGTVGVLGSGQLGRMFAIAARRMGYHVHTFSPDFDTPTGQVSDVEINAAYEDLDAVRKFAASVDVVTFEFENVPAPTAAAAAERAPVRPAGEVLHITQNRMREKTFLTKHGFPVTPYRSIRSLGDVEQARKDLGPHAIIKTADFGYDGKGQLRVDADSVIKLDFAANPDWVYEAFVHFQSEISVVAARGIDGSFTHWGLIDNTHRNGILDLSIAPADVSAAVQKKAIEITRGVLEALDVVGVLCVELFLTQSGDLLINELAPRPHNSGHLTFDASVTSQFEQQLRAVCGLPLGATDLMRPAAMANLLGDIWQKGEPNWQAACGFADAKLHLYGKQEARSGRKMGHITVLASTPAEAARIAIAAREAL